MSPLARATAVLTILVALAGCGSSPSSSTAPATSARAHTRPVPRRPVALRVAGSLGPLPEARSGVAVAPLGPSIYVNGGLSPAGVSTDTIFRIDGSGLAGSAGSLPSAIHDAAAAAVSGRLIVFGGGLSEGSDRIIQVRPGSPRLIGTLPQALSDLVAVPVGNTAYILGGWNGSDTNSDVYAAGASGTVSKVATLPLGVRYPAVAVLGHAVIVAGGETAGSTPTTDVWSLNTATHAVTALPHLPVATDHAAGAVLNGRFYLIGGEREGVFTNAILSWAPGDRRWRAAGHIPAAVSDLGAVAFDGGIAVVGGRGVNGRVATVTLLKAG